jgi:hypothetical protein
MTLFNKCGVPVQHRKVNSSWRHAKVAESQTNAIPSGGCFPPAGALARKCGTNSRGAKKTKHQNCSDRVLRSRLAVSRPITRQRGVTHCDTYYTLAEKYSHTRPAWNCTFCVLASPFCTAQVLPKFGRREKLIFLKWKVLRAGCSGFPLGAHTPKARAKCM